MLRRGGGGSTHAALVRLRLPDRLQLLIYRLQRFVEPVEHALPVLVVEQPVHGRVHQLVALDAGQVEGAEARRRVVVDGGHGHDGGQARRAVGQRAQRARHGVGGRARAAERHGQVREGARLDGRHQHVLGPRRVQRRPLQLLHVHVQHALLEGHAERLGRDGLQPRQQAQVGLVEPGAVQQPREVDFIRLGLLRPGRFRLAIIHARFVEDPLDEQLHEAVVLGALGHDAAALLVARQEGLHQRVHLAEALHARVARVPLLELHVVRDAGQRQQQTQVRVLLFRRRELLEIAEHFDDFIDDVFHVIVRFDFGSDAEEFNILVSEDGIIKLVCFECFESG